MRIKISRASSDIVAQLRAAVQQAGVVTPEELEEPQTSPVSSQVQEQAEAPPAESKKAEQVEPPKTQKEPVPAEAKKPKSASKATEKKEAKPSEAPPKAVEPESKPVKTRHPAASQPEAKPSTPPTEAVGKQESLPIQVEPASTAGAQASEQGPPPETKEAVPEPKHPEPKTSQAAPIEDVMLEVVRELIAVVQQEPKTSGTTVVSAPAPPSPQVAPQAQARPEPPPAPKPQVPTPTQLVEPESTEAPQPQPSGRERGGVLPLQTVEAINQLLRTRRASPFVEVKPSGGAYSATWRVEQRWQGGIGAYFLQDFMRELEQKIGASNLRLEHLSITPTPEGEDALTAELVGVLPGNIEARFMFAPKTTQATPPPMQPVAPAGLTEREQKARTAVAAAMAQYTAKYGVKSPRWFRKEGSELDFYTPYVMPPSHVREFQTLLMQNVGGVRDVQFQNVMVTRTGQEASEEGEFPGVKYTLYGATLEPVATLTMPLSPPRPNMRQNILRAFFAGLLGGFLRIRPSIPQELEYLLPGAEKEMHELKKAVGASSDTPKAYTSLSQFVNAVVPRSREASEFDILKSVARAYPKLAFPLPIALALEEGTHAEESVVQAAGASRLAVPLAYLLKASRTGSDAGEGGLDVAQAEKVLQQTYIGIAQRVGIKDESLLQSIQEAVSRAIQKLPPAEVPALGPLQFEEAVAAYLGPVRVREQAGRRVLTAGVGRVHPAAVLESLKPTPPDLTASVMMALTSAANDVASNRAQAAVMTNLLAAVYRKVGGPTHLAESNLYFVGPGGEPVAQKILLESPGPADIPKRADAAMGQLRQFFHAGRELLIRSTALESIRASRDFLSALMLDENKPNIIGRAFYEAVSGQPAPGSITAEQLHEALAGLWEKQWGNLANTAGVLLYGTHPSEFIGYPRGLTPVRAWPTLYSRLWSPSNLPSVATTAVLTAMGGLSAASGGTTRGWITRGVLSEVIRHVGEHGLPEDYTIETDSGTLNKSQVVEYLHSAGLHPEYPKLWVQATAWKSVISVLDKAWQDAVAGYQAKYTEDPYLPLLAGGEEGVSFQQSMSKLGALISERLEPWYKAVYSAAKESLPMQSLFGASLFDVLSRSLSAQEQQNLPAVGGASRSKRWWVELTPQEQQAIKNAIQEIESRTPRMLDQAVEAAAQLVESIQRLSPATVYKAQAAGAELPEVTASIQTLRRIKEEAFAPIKGPDLGGARPDKALLGVVYTEARVTSIGAYSVFRAAPYGEEFDVIVKLGKQPLMARVSYPPTPSNPVAPGVGFKVYQFLRTMLTPSQQEVPLAYGHPVDLHFGKAILRDVDESQNKISVQIESTPAALEVKPLMPTPPASSPVESPRPEEFGEAHTGYASQYIATAKQKLLAYQTVVGLRETALGIPLADVPEPVAQRVGWTPERQREFYVKAATVSAAMNLMEMVPETEEETHEKLANVIAEEISQMRVPHGVGQMWHHSVFVRQQLLNKGIEGPELALAIGQGPGAQVQRLFSVEPLTTFRVATKQRPEPEA